MTPQEIFDVLKEKFEDQVIDLTESVDPFVRVKRGEVIEEDLLRERVGILEVDRLHPQ